MGSREKSVRLLCLTVAALSVVLAAGERFGSRALAQESEEKVPEPLEGVENAFSDIMEKLHRWAQTSEQKREGVDGAEVEGEVDEKRKFRFTIGDLRFRHEYRDNFDFDNDVDDNDNLEHFKLKLGAGVEWRDLLSIETNWRYTRTWGANQSASRQQDKMGLHEGYLQFDPLGKSPLDVKVGRQELRFGEERLIGDNSWVNYDRTFDAARAGWDGKWAEVDLFAAREVLVEGPDDVAFNRANRDESLLGIYIRGNVEQLKAQQRQDVEKFPFLKSFYEGFEIGARELYLLRKYNSDEDRFAGELRGNDPLEIYTIGGRNMMNLGKHWSWSDEAAYQFGERGPDSHHAIAAAARLIYFPRREGSALESIALFGAMASGDEDPFDGRSQRFDQLYPDNHGQFGIMDQIGWSNVRQLGAEVTLNFGRWLPYDAIVGGSWVDEEEQKKDDRDFWDELFSSRLSIGYHFLWLDEGRDGLFDAQGTLVRRQTATNPSRQVGQELDIELNFGALSLGYGRFMTGSYLSDTGEDDDAGFFYFMFGSR